MEKRVTLIGNEPFEQNPKFYACIPARLTHGRSDRANGNRVHIHHRSPHGGLRTHRRCRNETRHKCIFDSRSPVFTLNKLLYVQIWFHHEQWLLLINGSFLSNTFDTLLFHAISDHSSPIIDIHTHILVARYREQQFNSLLQVFPQSRLWE